MNNLKKFSISSLNIPIIICFIFFVLYSILGIIRHNYYGSFGADLGFIDRQFWIYSNFSLEGLITGSHIEFTSLLLTPLYWIWADPRMLILFQSFSICSSGIAIFLLARRNKLNNYLSFVILLSYLTFFGVQNAVWFDVHTSVWGAAFFMWFIYFLDNDNKKAAILTFLLTIGSKENFAGYTFLFCLAYFVMTRKKIALGFAAGSLVYLFFLFRILFPMTLPNGYAYTTKGPVTSISPWQMVDSEAKRKTIFFTFAWVGFLPILTPIYAIPILGNLGSYFILGRGYIAAHEIFMHYRVDLLPLLLGGLVFTIKKVRLLNNKYIAAYLLVCLLVFQYVLHSPLSYLTKKWFWTKPSGVDSINAVIREIPSTARIAAQNNIYPHVSERNTISLLWPDIRNFKDDSPCGKSSCPWLGWKFNPEYIIVDLSPEWDIRHLLWQNEDYRSAVSGLEKMGVIQKYKQQGSTTLYRVLKSPK